MENDETYTQAWIAWLKGGPPPTGGEPIAPPSVGPNQALYEIIMQGRRRWAARPHTYMLDIDDWDEARLWDELRIEIDGLAAFLAAEMTDVSAARVAFAGIEAITAELRARRRKGECA